MLVQAVEAFSTLYESNYPMRFGVILLSGKVLERIEANGPDGIFKDKHLNTDLSTLVNSLSPLSLTGHFNILIDFQALFKLQSFNVLFWNLV